MDKSIIIKIIMGIAVFTLVPHMANKLNRPVAAAIFGAVPVPIFLTFFITSNKHIIDSWGKMQLILPPMGILFGILFYLLVIKYKINKNISASIIILLWLIIGIIAYILFPN